jgi:hypothetical protein
MFCHQNVRHEGHSRAVAKSPVTGQYEGVVRPRACVFSMVILICGLFGAGGSPASAVTTSLFPHRVVGGFAMDSGELSVVYADGSVRVGQVGSDASQLRMNAPVVGGAAGPVRGGYWVVGSDGGVFSFNAPFYGSLGGQKLNQPVSAIAATKARRGYWLVARDGGVFTFGDARFYGSAGAIRLRQPMVGMQRTATGKGYRLVARDGGVFNYGDAKYYGSLPGRGIDVADVVGIAMTPTGRGYWIARRNGQVFAFGDARIEYAAPSSCAPISAIVGNGLDAGFRLIGASGACGRVTARIQLPARTMRAGSFMAGRVVVENDTGSEIHVPGCIFLFQVQLTNDAIHQFPLWNACLEDIPIPVGETIYPVTVSANYNSCTNGEPDDVMPKCLPGGRIPPLPPGDYRATFFQSSTVVPSVASIGVRVTP